MAGVDLRSFNALVYAQLKTAAAGAAVRAKVGLGAVAPATAADSIIHARDLNADALPARPLLALRRGAMPGNSYDMRIPTWRWWVYDDPGEGYYRINELLKLIEQAYSLNSIAFAQTKIANVSEELPIDPALGLLPSSIQIALYTRG